MAFPKYDVRTLQRRVKIAQNLGSQEAQASQLEFGTRLVGKPHVHDIPFPSGLAPLPEPIVPIPSPLNPLPKADVIAMVDTVAEAAAMADVLTPGVPYTEWYPYARRFKEHYLPLVGPKGPSRGSKRLGSYFLTKINEVRVLCYKTELHLAPDAKKLPDGTYSLPIKDMLQQIIGDVQPAVFLTTGTSGGVYTSMHLGDVVVTRAARFHCEAHFKERPFNNATYKSNWTIPTAYRDAGRSLMQLYAGQLADPAPAGPAGSPGVPQAKALDAEDYMAALEMAGPEVDLPAARAMAMAVSGPPSDECASAPPGHPTLIFYDGQGDIPPFHPILTTDYFEFGTSTNRLDTLGMAVEMDDAVLGLVCSEMPNPPHWASIRNLSDPTINGALDKRRQESCAVYYYAHFGYWTTVMSALTTWSVVAGMES